MDLTYRCACCGSTNEIFLEKANGLQQELVEDCAVCCRPMVITAQWTEFSPSAGISKSRRRPMGDKSPKSKERNMKQDTWQKSQKSAKKAGDFASAHPAPAVPRKKK